MSAVEAAGGGAGAGIGFAGDEQTSADLWDRMWHVNLMSHVHAARRLIPAWLARGEGSRLRSGRRHHTRALRAKAAGGAGRRHVGAGDGEG